MRFTRISWSGKCPHKLAYFFVPNLSRGFRYVVDEPTFIYLDDSKKKKLRFLHLTAAENIKPEVFYSVSWLLFPVKNWRDEKNRGGKVSNVEGTRTGHLVEWCKVILSICFWPLTDKGHKVGTE